MSEFVNDEQLKSWLTELRLPWIRDRLEQLLDDAARREMSLRDLVVLLCREELSGKRRMRIVRRLAQARFPMVRELDDFDCQAQPSVDPDRLRELAGSRWVANGDNLLLLGPPGVGKTHLAISLGRAAIEHDFSVRFVAASTLMTTLMRAYETERWDACLRDFGKPQLLIVDEFGYLPVPTRAAHLLFQLVAERYERGSVLLTSNRAIGDWGEMLGDPVAATAILDRLLHHSEVISMRGDSYRLREKRRAGLVASRSTEPVDHAKIH